MDVLSSLSILGNNEKAVVQSSYLRVQGYTGIMENQMEKKMENEMETREYIHSRYLRTARIKSQQLFIGDPLQSHEEEMVMLTTDWCRAFQNSHGISTYAARLRILSYTYLYKLGRISFSRSWEDVWNQPMIRV